jgi:DNA-binding MarR family transcriptional regulator
MEPDHSLQRDALALHEAILHLMLVYHFRDRDSICCYDVSVTQCYALEMLVSRGPMRGVELADALRLDKSTTSRVVDALVRKNYVDKRVDAKDARAISLSVTRTGRALYQRINRELINQQAELLRGLDPEVRASATAIIRRLASAAETHFVSGSGMTACPPSCVPVSAGSIPQA